MDTIKNPASVISDEVALVNPNEIKSEAALTGSDGSGGKKPNPKLLSN